MIPRTTNTFLCKQLHLTRGVVYLMHVNRGLVSAAASLAPPPQSCLQKCLHLKNVLPDPSRVGTPMGVILLLLENYMKLINFMKIN